MAAVFAVCSAALFGAMTVALRFALRRAPDAEAGTFATVAVAFAVSLVAIAVTGAGDVDVRDLAFFALAGAIAPGLSQLFFTLGVRDAGASRASVVVGTAPLFAVVIALVALDEPPRVPLLVGAALVAVGGIVLAAERVRPEDFKHAGMAFALICTLLFAVRDNVVRWFSGETDVAPAPAAAATLLGGLVVIGAFALRRVRGRHLTAFAPVGLLFGVSYIFLFAAYYRGRVGVVSPLVATESLWGVGLSALLLGRSELVGRHLALGAALIVAGGALIGLFR